MEIFVVSFVLFGLVCGGLAATQWLRKQPMPVGCTPVNGECCRQLNRDGPCTRNAAHIGNPGRAEREIRNAGS